MVNSDARHLPEGSTSKNDNASFLARTDDLMLAVDDPVLLLSRYGHAGEISHRRQATRVREFDYFDFYEGVAVSAPRPVKDAYEVEVRLGLALSWSFPAQPPWEPCRRACLPGEIPRSLTLKGEDHPGSFLAAYVRGKGTMVLFQELYFLQEEYKADTGRVAERLSAYEQAMRVMNGDARQPRLADQALATLARMFDPVELLRLVESCPGGREAVLEQLRRAGKGT